MELKDIVSKYRQTLVQERKLKDKLVAKLEAIATVVARHDDVKHRTPSKPGGIPFGLGVMAAAFMPRANAGDNKTTHADQLLTEIKQILENQH
tara:strand:- start:123 stop:401 length:279 start_codon:yes stop_codon:yes gene_type:complete